MGLAGPRQPEFAVRCFRLMPPPPCPPLIWLFGFRLPSRRAVIDDAGLLSTFRHCPQPGACPYFLLGSDFCRRVCFDPWLAWRDLHDPRSPRRDQLQDLCVSGLICWKVVFHKWRGLSRIIFTSGDYGIKKTPPGSGAWCGYVAIDIYESESHKSVSHNETTYHILPYTLQLRRGN